MTKDSLKKIWENKTLRAVLVGMGALLLLVALWRSFFQGGSAETSSAYEPTETETRISELLSAIEGIDEATVYINEADGAAQTAVVVFEGADSILVRMRILNVVSAALDIEKQSVQVYLAG